MSDVSDNLHRGVRAVAAVVAGAPGAALVDHVLPEVGSWFGDSSSGTSDGPPTPSSERPSSPK